MATSLHSKSAECNLERILRYLDDDLSETSHLEFEAHLTECETCIQTLNREKHLLLAVNNCEMVTDTPTLPVDFARKVSVAAVNDIATIRQPGERRVAMAICALLALFAFAALGGTFNGFSGSIDGASALISIIGNLLYRIAFGLTAVVRPFSNYMGGNSLGLFTGLLVVLGLAAFYFHRTIKSGRNS